MAYIGNNPSVSGNFSSTIHSGTGSSLGPFSIGQSPGTKNAVLVFIDGVRQVPTIYNVSGSEVTFTAGNAPPLGTDNVQILVSGEELGINVPADDSVAVDELNTTSAGSTGQFLQKSGASTIDWTTVPDEVPTQTGQAGKFLTTDGSTTSWGSTGAADSVFWENAQTVSSDYTITASTNALTLGNLIINSGITVTIPSGARWYIL